MLTGMTEVSKVYQDFLNKFYKLVMDNKDKNVEADRELLRVRANLISDIEQRFNSFSLNTVIAGFMEYNNKLNELSKKNGVDKET